MKTVEWKWNTKDGLEIHSKAWEPEGGPKAVVCLVHGLGEHIGRYEVDGEYLTRAGFAAAGFDQRGFGRSGGRRGHLPSPDAYFEDLDVFLQEVEKRFPGIPRFLSGFSMGGVLVIGYAQSRRPKIAGVITSGPGLKSELEDQKFKIFLARLLGRIAPTLTFKTGLHTERASRDPRVAQELLNDPLVHFNVTAGWACSMLEVLELAWKDPQHFPYPLLLMHGAADEIADPQGTRRFASLAPGDKVTLKLWEGMKHELHTDPQKAKMFAFMIGWMEEHLPSATLRGD